jgi:hypothetical protein
VEQIANALLVQRLEAAPGVEPAARQRRRLADVELGKAGHGHRPGVAAQHARQRGAERHGPEG